MYCSPRERKKDYSHDDDDDDDDDNGDDNNDDDDDDDHHHHHHHRIRALTVRLFGMINIAVAEYETFQNCDIHYLQKVWTFKFRTVNFGHFSHFRQIFDKNFGRFAETLLKQICAYETRIILEKRVKMIVLPHP